MKALVLALPALLVLSPAVAGETPWQEVAPDVRMRLISTDALTPEGTAWVAVEIDMPEATKTYWRVPGETGIPPRFDLAGSSGIGGFEIAWPFPTRETAKGYLDHAYYGHTVFPLELAVAGDAVRLEAEIMLGICSDICVPASASFSHAFDFSAPDRANALRIQQALADVPLAWGDGEPLGEAVFDSASGELSVEVTRPGFWGAEIIADVAGSPALFGPPVRGEARGDMVFPLLGKTALADFDGAPVHITFLTARGPYEIVRELRVR